MKKILIVIVALSVLVISCEQDLSEITKSPYNKEVDNFAKLKINFASVKRANPSYQIMINETRVSSLITARYPYPGGGFNTGGLSTGDYLAVPTGTVKVKMSTPFLGTNNDSVVYFDGTIELPDAGNYTFHVADTGTNIKSVLFKEDLTVVSGAIPRFKLVNLMPNVPSIDLYYGPTLLASNIEYLKSSQEFTIDTSQSSKLWSVRAAGALPTSTAIATYDGANTLGYGRKYTAFAMGYSGLSGTTEPRRPFISFFYTR